MLPANNSLHFVNMMFFMISFFLLTFCIFVLRERVWVHQAVGIVGIVVIDLLSVGSTVLILFLLFLTAIT